MLQIISSGLELKMAKLPVHSIYNRKDKDLEQHHTDMLKPTDSFNTHYNTAVDALASFLRNNSGFKVAETVKVKPIVKFTVAKHMHMLLQSTVVEMRRGVAVH